MSAVVSAAQTVTVAVGEVVLYRITDADLGQYARALRGDGLRQASGMWNGPEVGTECPAIVSEVASDGDILNLHVFMPSATAALWAPGRTRGADRGQWRRR